MLIHLTDKKEAHKILNNLRSKNLFCKNEKMNI
jgi:hypothetical protein